LGGRALSSIDFQSSINLPKMEASKLDAAVLHAMRACGFSGYSNDTEYRPPPPWRGFPDHDQQRPHVASMGTATLMSAVFPCPIDFLLEGMGLDRNMATFSAVPVEPTRLLGSACRAMCSAVPSALSASLIIRIVRWSHYLWRRFPDDRKRAVQLPLLVGSMQRSLSPITNRTAPSVRVRREHFRNGLPVHSDSAQGYTITNAAQAAKIVAEAMSANGPVVIELQSDVRQTIDRYVVAASGWCLGVLWSSEFSKDGGGAPGVAAWRASIPDIHPEFGA
jgi:hypothetical protein